MTIVAPWGMWQCSDHRVMHLRRKRNRQWAVVRTDDYSPKHIQLMCVGGSALLTYSGLGMIGNNHLSDWLRRLVRGPIRTLDETLIRIQEEATATLAGAAAKAEVIHAFTIGAILQGHPWAVVITNLGWPPGSPPLDRFETDMQTTDEPKALFFGAGRDAVSAEDWALVKRVAARRPRRPEDYSKLLAYVHRRAKHSKHPARHTISEACTTSYMPPTGFG